MLKIVLYIFYSLYLSFLMQFFWRQHYTHYLVCEVDCWIFCWTSKLFLFCLLLFILYRFFLLKPFLVTCLNLFKYKKYFKILFIFNQMRNRKAEIESLLFESILENAFDWIIFLSTFSASQTKNVSVCTVYGLKMLYYTYMKILQEHVFFSHESSLFLYIEWYICTDKIYNSLN